MDNCFTDGTQQVTGGEVAAEVKTNDKKSFWFALLAFWHPILLGLILYLVYEGKKPLRAKSLKKGAIVGVIVRAVLILLVVGIYVAAAIGSAMYTQGLIDGIAI